MAKVKQHTLWVCALRRQETRKKVFLGQFIKGSEYSEIKALKYNLFSISDFIAAIRSRAAGVSVVVTGRGAHPDVIKLADDVIEMKEIKHYFQAGVPARVGIEK